MNSVSIIPRLARSVLMGLLLLCQQTAANAQAKTPTVLVALVEHDELIEEVPVFGSVISPRIANLSTEVSGIVENMQIDVGDQVHAGDRILSLNSELSALSLAATRAATAQAKGELEDTKRRLADARVLAERHSVSASEIESLVAEVRIDTAGLQRFLAEQQQQAARLRRHQLKAPFSGVINRKLVEQGEWVQPGEPVVELVATTGLRIDFHVPQIVYAKFDQATSILIKLDALPGQIFDGRIESIIPVANPDTRTFMLRAALIDQGVELVPGMSAGAMLRLHSGSQGLVVPRDALMRYPDGRITVWVIDKEKDTTSVSEHPVQTGLSFNGKVAISGDLSVGTHVVIKGNEALRDSQKVIVRHSE